MSGQNGSWDPAWNVEAFLVSSLPNVRYLSGFTGSNGMVLLTPGSMTLFTDPRYTIQAAEETSAKIIIARGPLIHAAAKVIRRRRLRRLGFEKEHLSYEAWQDLEKALGSAVKLQAAAGWIERRRMVKSPAEVDRIRRAVETNSRAFSNAVKKIRPGMSEAELAAELEYQMRRRGAEKPSFETIVASGKRTALPHAQPTSERFREHELVLIDMGATQDGYASDMTRMVFLGKPAAKAAKMYEAVLEAQLAAIDAVREGTTGGKVDRAARRVLESRGLGKEFVHSTGHGLGLEIHEPPRLGRKDKTPLVAGMVVTIEPGAYIRGFGGVRIEDTVLVTQNGCEVLTPTSKELMVL